MAGWAAQHGWPARNGAWVATKFTWPRLPASRAPPPSNPPRCSTSPARGAVQRAQVKPCTGPAAVAMRGREWPGIDPPQPSSTASSTWCLATPALRLSNRSLLIYVCGVWVRKLLPKTTCPGQEGLSCVINPHLNKTDKHLNRLVAPGAPVGGCSAIASKK